jgi:hypothetical protein
MAQDAHKIAPRWARIAQGGPKMAPTLSKIAPIGPNMVKMAAQLVFNMGILKLFGLHLRVSGSTMRILLFSVEKAMCLKVAGGPTLPEIVQHGHQPGLDMVQDGQASLEMPKIA